MRSRPIQLPGLYACILEATGREPDTGYTDARPPTSVSSSDDLITNRRLCRQFGGMACYIAQRAYLELSVMVMMQVSCRLAGVAD
jgi:hypothetical protein